MTITTYKPGWQIMSISNPTSYSEQDLLNFATKKIEIHNWATLNGGRMTPYESGFSAAQKTFITKLYAKGQRTFWLGFTNNHIGADLGLSIAKLVKMTKQMLSVIPADAYVGIYVPKWQDEILTMLHDGMTPMEQYTLVKSAHDSFCALMPAGSRVKWLITGAWKVNYQGISVDISKWMYAKFVCHTNVVAQVDCRDYVYDDQEERLKNYNFPRFAWTDSTLVTGSTGAKTFTALGKTYFLL